MFLNEDASLDYMQNLFKQYVKERVESIIYP